MESYKVWTAVFLALVVAAGAGVISRRAVNNEPHNATKAYVIPVTGSANIPTEQSDTTPPIEPLLAKADVAHGEQLFKQCAVCHSAKKGDPHKIGPNLWNVVGAAIAHCANYAYSDSFNKKKNEIKWTYENLNIYLHKPRKFVPGTKMSFAGLMKDHDRADIIAYLRTQADTPLPLPDPDSCLPPH